MNKQRKQFYVVDFWALEGVVSPCAGYKTFYNSKNAEAYVCKHSGSFYRRIFFGPEGWTFEAVY